MRIVTTMSIMTVCCVDETKAARERESLGDAVVR